MSFLKCVEPQKEVFLSFKNSFLEAVARSENSLTHNVKTNANHRLCVSQTGLKTVVSEAQKEMFQSLKKT